MGTEKGQMNHKSNLEINRNRNFCSNRSRRKPVFISGIRLKMCPGTASCKRIVCCSGRTLVGLLEAFIASLIRNLLALKSLAFPGSMVVDTSWRTL